MGALIVLIAACVVSEFFWWVVGFVAVGVAVYYAVKFCNAADRKQLARLNNRLDLAARADQQHQWVIEGDTRGTHGKYPPAGIC